jgi:hypothetical protein
VQEKMQQEIVWGRYRKSTSSDIQRDNMV